MTNHLLRIRCMLQLLVLVLSHHASSIAAYAPLAGLKATSMQSGQSMDLSKFLTTCKSSSPVNTADRDENDSNKSMLILGTYAADFNAIEYAQRLRYYAPQLHERGVHKIGFVLNCKADAATKLVELVDLDAAATNDKLSTRSTAAVEVFIDPNGTAGRAFGVERGWLPDNDDISPYVKLFGMLWGLGAWATLPAVIGGYIGNPFGAQPWIEDAMAVGQRKGRWPNTALVLDENNNGEVLVNKFEQLPWVGGWKRRPLELATLRLQNMLGISIKHWKDLAPDEEALRAGVLTQLGGCVIVDRTTGDEVYKWRDPGICAVANFEDILQKLPVQKEKKTTTMPAEVSV